MTVDISHKPLLDRTVVVTRRAEDAPALIRRLEALGAHVWLVPCLATQAVPKAVWAHAWPKLACASCVAFSSRQGVWALQRALADHAQTLPAQAALWAVGPATAACIQATFGRNAKTATPHCAEGLAKALLADLKAGQDQVVLPGAEAGRTHVADALRAGGVAVTALPLYRTTGAPGPDAVLPKQPDYVLFTSPSSVVGWLSRGPHPDRARCLSIGPTTSRALVAHGLSVFAQAEVHTLDGLVAALLEHDRP